MLKKALMVVYLWLFFVVAAYSATVNLAWDRSPDPGVAGYNIYRATMSGGPYTKLNLMLILQPVSGMTPMYSDTTPAGSQLTYYYVVRAESIGGVESANSNEVVFNPPPSPPTNLRIVSFTTASLKIDNQTVASGPPYPIVYVLPRQTPPRAVPIQVTVQ